MKYVLVEGDVKSRDGDIHHISSHRLIELYGLNPKKCIFDEKIRNERLEIINRYPEVADEDYVWLEPRSEGDYKEYLEMVLECCERDRKSQEDNCLNCVRMNRCGVSKMFDDFCIAYDRMY